MFLENNELATAIKKPPVRGLLSIDISY